MSSADVDIEGEKEGRRERNKDRLWEDSLPQLITN